MASDGGGTRVLIVDDLDDMRTALRRVLTTHGYQVDVASTLGEARSMDPGSYDAVIVDAHLGADRGTDMIETLVAEDPTAAQRCLLITGGPIDKLPADVPHLAKPFYPYQLLAALRGLGRPDGEAAAARGLGRPDREPAAAPGLGRPGTASGPAPPTPSRGPATQPSIWQLLAIIRHRRQREGGALADFIHDGPIQQLAAATLAVHALRRSDPPSLAESLDELPGLLNAAARSLRSLVDRQWQDVSGRTTPGELLRQQTGWLLAEPVALDTRELAGLGDAEVAVVVDIVELMLLAAVPGGTQVTAHAGLATRDSEIEIKLTVKHASAAGPAANEAAAAQSALSELACALGADVQTSFGSQEWRASLVMATPAASGAQ